ncbi:hypothetical protein B0H11DRAFT_1922446 [Mycena galericulata]|nr:hypothetical protein B0H11DRAFT_1922446 [Mycena galericulata]
MTLGLVLRRDAIVRNRRRLRYQPERPLIGTTVDILAVYLTAWGWSSDSESGLNANWFEHFLLRTLVVSGGVIVIAPTTQQCALKYSGRTNKFGAYIACGLLIRREGEPRTNYAMLCGRLSRYAARRPINVVDSRLALPSRASIYPLQTLYLFWCIACGGGNLKAEGTRGCT